MTSPGPTRHRLASEQAASPRIAHASGAAGGASRAAFHRATEGTNGSGGPGLPSASIAPSPLAAPTANNCASRTSMASLKKAISGHVTRPRLVQRARRRPANRDRHGPPPTRQDGRRSRHSQNARAPPREANATKVIAIYL